MKAAYVDTSCLVAVAFDERGRRALAKRLRGYDRLVASNLLEAELAATLVREGVGADPSGLLAHLDWLFPDRPLTPEYSRVLSAGYVRGADLWHLACALYLSPDPAQLHFLTLDKRQADLAGKLGLKS